jgi:hypothetical protein
VEEDYDPNEQPVAVGAGKEEEDDKEKDDPKKIMKALNRLSNAGLEKLYRIAGGLQ